MTPGRFITFEGGDRCGKSTQARLLKRNLDSQGQRCLLTAEPGGSVPLGTALRSVLLDPSIDRDEVTAALLFSADRHEHVKRTIRPALAEGRWVICDRYADSTFAYQGGGGNVDLDLLRQLTAIATDGLMPELTVLLLLDPDKRAKRNPKLDYYDRGRGEFELRTQAMFEKLAAEDPDRFLIIDGDQPIDAIATQIFSVVRKQFLSERE